MRRIRVKRIAITVSLLLTSLLLCNVLVPRIGETDNTISSSGAGRIHLVVVACEGKSNSIVHEAVTMIKSCLVFSTNALQIHIFTDNLEEDFRNEFDSWPKAIWMNHKVLFHPVEYTLSEKEKSKIRNWWGPCSSYRLFLPDSLHSVDSVLYVDADVIFLGPVQDVWDHFVRFDNKQVAGLAPRVGWDFKVTNGNPNFISSPTGKLTQVNAGVILMNLTRMRSEVFKSDPAITTQLQAWSWKLLKPLYVKNRSNMFGDQNLINTVFHYNPDLVYLLPCKYNYHHKFCFDDREERQCTSAEAEGAAVIHGSANTFYNNYAPAFAVINTVLRMYNFEDDWNAYLLQPMLRHLADPKVDEHAHCGGKKTVLTLHLRRTIKRLGRHPN